MEIKDINNYLLRTLDIEIKAEEISIEGIPFFIRKQFALFSAGLYYQPICFLLSNKATFVQHQFKDIIASNAFFYEKTNLLPVFVFSAITKQQRLELVKQKISFIVPETQMYIPSIVLDFSDRIPQVSNVPSKVLRPAAQAIIIQQLLTGKLENLTVNQASKVMKYTAMGTLRAVDQLNDLGLCEVKYNGFSKTLHFPQDLQTLWNKAKVFLRNPIKKTFSIEDDFELKKYPLAGEFVLAKYSDLSVERKTYVIEQKDLTILLRENKIKIAYSQETGCADVQVWSYSLPIWKNEVDLFSLELSLKDVEDARVKIALLDLKKQLPI
jgi:hypothetical protein